MTLTAAAFRPSTDPFGVHLLRSPLTPTRSLRGIGKYCEAFRKEGRAIGGRKWFLASVNATAHALPAKNYLGNRFVYCVVSQRAGGLSLGVNANPDKHCNFDCVYCEVDRTLPGREGAVDVTVMLEELERLLVQVAAGRLSEIAGVPTTLEFKEVALSGDGEPTLSANFREVVEAVVGLRARRHFPFKIVVITNGTGLHLPSVRLGLSSLSARDDVWIKLDAGSPAAYRRINRSETPFDLLLRNIRDLGRRRSIVIQSLFPLYDGEGPAEAEIEAYVRCLRNLRSAGASIALVQVYSAHRAAADGRCGHLSLRVLSGIARRIREGTGLPAEVFQRCIHFRSDAARLLADTDEVTANIIQALTESAVFREYERAFSDATGLPVSITPVESWQVPHRGKKAMNAFCEVMAQKNCSCAACLRTQGRLTEGAREEACTEHCAMGMVDSAVPIRLGGELLGFLKTGQVFCEKPTAATFAQVSRQLEEWGVPVTAELEEAYFATRVMTPDQYRAMVDLLTIFSRHLALIANQVAVRQENAEPPMITRAKEFIKNNQAEDLSLGQVARAVNTSTFYFCKMFKKATGLNFTEYLSRVRIEKAKNLLLNPNLRVSEIAFEVGFQSLTHFNRVFKKITGQSPTEYREKIV